VSAKAILEQLKGSGQKLIFAESITGGLLADEFIREPGASDVVLGSEVTYSNELKGALLGVDEELLEAKGAVSSDVAMAMAQGVYAVGLGASDLESGQLVAVSTTGNAGPSGSPVGLVFIAVTDGKRKKVREFNFTGSREEIRRQAVDSAVTMIWEQIKP
jgi:PncC family amidohydrolase